MGTRGYPRDVPRCVKVPPPLEALFDRTEGYIARRFANVSHQPDAGAVRVDGERFVMVRAESLYVGLCDGFVRRLGTEAAFELIYTMAWEIGHTDCQTMTWRMGASDPMQRVACGPPFFAHCGWASVELLGDSTLVAEDDCFVHYFHPNTFELEVLSKRGDIGVGGPACVFSAGYSAGWVSCAMGLDLHAREIRCRTQGADECEFIMAPTEHLDAHQTRLSGVAAT